ncbi:MAG: pyridoxal-phosphate dependent enzyme [Proteobacteria bacterium]|nr:pyridoxal-phosphate dependent enzyme [Pseudomonadota bacterium]
MSQYTLRCADCGHQSVEDQYYIQCPACSGFLEVELAAVPSQPVDDRFESIFKYHPVMPYDPLTEDILGYENFVETPVVFAEHLSGKLGIELYYKDEVAMPSGTWKDREGFVSIHRLLKNNIADLVVFSSGNTATSLARSASIIKGPRLHIAVPSASRQRIQTYREFFDPEYVKVHFFDGSNDECIVQVEKIAQDLGYQIEGGFANYARREGLKLLALEVMFGWGKPVDWYVQPVASGIGIYSYHKAYRDLGIEAQCPKLLGVQADICAPMVNAWRAGSTTLEECYIPQEIVPSDFVRVLRTRKPVDSYPILKRIMDKVNGRFEAVSDAQILEGLRLFYVDEYYLDVFRRTGKMVGLEPATAMAGVVKGVAEGYIQPGEKVLLNVSGAAKAGDLNKAWLSELL